MSEEKPNEGKKEDGKPPYKGKPQSGGGSHKLSVLAMHIGTKMRNVLQFALI